MNNNYIREHALAKLLKHGLIVSVNAEAYKIYRALCFCYKIQPETMKSKKWYYQAICNLTFDSSLDSPKKPSVNANNVRRRIIKPKAKSRFATSSEFYQSDSWRSLRYQALEVNGGACQCCGRTRKHGIVLHVDHIKPRSLYPELELRLDNLQVLCEDCNMGKSNKFATDWR